MHSMKKLPCDTEVFGFDLKKKRGNPTCNIQPNKQNQLCKAKAVLDIDYHIQYSISMNIPLSNIYIYLK